MLQGTELRNQQVFCIFCKILCAWTDKRTLFAPHVPSEIVSASVWKGSNFLLPWIYHKKLNTWIQIHFFAFFWCCSSVQETLLPLCDDCNKLCIFRSKGYTHKIAESEDSWFFLCEGVFILLLELAVLFIFTIYKFLCMYKE